MVAVERKDWEPGESFPRLVKKSVFFEMPLDEMFHVDGHTVSKPQLHEQSFRRKCHVTVANRTFDQTDSHATDRFDCSGVNEHSSPYIECDSICLFAVGVTLLCVGYFLGRCYDSSHTKGTYFGLVAVAMLIASFRFYNAYTFFASHFAKTVWRDFLAFNANRSS